MKTYNVRSLARTLDVHCMSFDMEILQHIEKN